MIFYKVLAFYNNLFRFILKPFVTFLSICIVYSSIFHNNILSNFLFVVVFIIFSSFFTLLIYFRFFYKKSVFFRINDRVCYLPVFFVGEGIIARSVVKKAATSIASLTANQMLAGSGALVAGVVALEVTANSNLALAADIRATGLEREAAQCADSNLPNTAQFRQAQADFVRAQEAARYPGGEITASVSNRIVSAVNSIHPQPVSESQRIQQVCDEERLKSLQENSDIEMQEYRDNLIRQRELLAATRDRERIDQQIADRKEIWDNMDLMSKGYVHLERAASTVTEVSNRLSQSPEGNTIRQGLTTRVTRALSSIIVGRVELHYTMFPSNEKRLFPLDDQTFGDDLSKKAKTSFPFVEHLTEENLIPAFYDDDKHKHENSDGKKLISAPPINKDFLDALNEYHKEAKNLENEIKKDLENIKKKD